MTNQNNKDGIHKISERTNRLSPSGIRKFFDLLNSVDGVISLGVGEPDYVTPRPIIDTAIESLENGQTMYTSNMGIPELRREISRYLAKEYEVEYNPDTEILITVGVSEALDLAMRAVLDPGDEIIMPDPHYVAYDSCVVMAGGSPVKVPTYESSSFELNPADVEEKVNEKTRGILIGYPANPTGAVLGKDKLSQLAELAREKGLLVISDEIYSRLVYGVKHTCTAALPGMKEYTILLGGFSKAYAMTGWRIGYAAAPAEIIAAMTKIHQYTMMCAPTMGQVAAIEALRSGEDSVKEMVDDYNRRRMVIVKGFRDIGMSCFEPKGAFYAFPSVRETGMTSEEFANKLLTEEKVAVVPGNAFGDMGEGYVRCCYATSLSDIKEALSRVKRFVGKYGK